MHITGRYLHLCVDYPDYFNANGANASFEFQILDQFNELENMRQINRKSEENSSNDGRNSGEKSSESSSQNEGLRMRIEKKIQDSESHNSSSKKKSPPKIHRKITENTGKTEVSQADKRL